MTDTSPESNAPYPTMSATYDPQDNKFRLSSLHRLEPETYARVKAAGFSWAPKLELFIAPMWTPAREDLLLELCGQIDDEDSTLVDRAEARAERFDDYHDKREREAAQTHQSVERIMDGIPLGQPILIGHHSEKHARKDAQRIEDGIRKAVKLWDTAQYWQDRARNALRDAKYKELPAVRARRIKTLEAALRKQQRMLAEHAKLTAAWQAEPCTLERAKAIANYDHMSFKFSLADYPREPPASQYEGDMGLWSALDGGVITAEQARVLALKSHRVDPKSHALRWLAHFENRIAYERTMLGEAGGTVADQTKPEKGGACMCWASPQRGWSYIVKVNKVSVSVLDNWGNGGKNFTRIIPFDKLSKVMTAQEVQELRESGQLIEASNGVGFYRQGNLESLPAHVQEHAASKQDPALAETVQAVSVAHGLEAVPNVPTLTTRAMAAMKQTLKAGVQVVTVEQLFPTPPALADRMVALAKIQPGQRVLEPSAGTGRLVEAIGRVPLFESDMNSSILAIDNSESLTLALAARRIPRITVTCADFLTLVPAEHEPFDACVINPPFARAADTAHVLHALQFLKPMGCLVAITSAMAGARGTKTDQFFQETMDRLGAYRELLPSGTFHDSGTDVHAALWVVEMPKAETVPQTETLTAQARSLSSGTLASLIGERSYAAIDEVQADFVAWCERQENQHQPWQDAWNIFWPRVKPRSLETLAHAIDTASTKTQAKITKERMQSEWQGKQQPRKAQAAPRGLFEQVQGTLF